MWAWWLAAAAGVVVTGAHWMAWRRAASSVLPTARFVPAGARPVQTRRVALDEPALWILRLLIVGCLGAAMAPGLWRLPRAGRARVVLVDATRAVGSASERADSAMAWLTDGSRVEVIAFDSTTRAVATGDLASLPRSDVAGALDAALVVAARRATTWRARARDVEVVVVSPVVEEEWTPAIPAIVREAGVPVRWVRLAPARVTAPIANEAAVGPTPSAATPAVMGMLNAVGHLPAATRVIAGTYRADDTAFAARGGVVVSFAEPQDDAPVRALLAGDAGAIGPWGTAPLGQGTPVAWWDDGAVAATQEAVGAGCFRTVGVRLPVRGDDILRPSMARVIRRLVAPCTTSRLDPVPAGRLPIAADGPRLAATPASDTGHRRWWLAIAVLLMAVEWGLRRRRKRGAS